MTEFLILLKEKWRFKMIYDKVVLDNGEEYKTETDNGLRYAVVYISTVFHIKRVLGVFQSLYWADYFVSNSRIKDDLKIEIIKAIVGREIPFNVKLPFRFKTNKLLARHLCGDLKAPRNNIVAYILPNRNTEELSYHTDEEMTRVFENY